MNNPDYLYVFSMYHFVIYVCLESESVSKSGFLFLSICIRKSFEMIFMGIEIILPSFVVEKGPFWYFERAPSVPQAVALLKSCNTNPRAIYDFCQSKEKLLAQILTRKASQKWSLLGVFFSVCSFARLLFCLLCVFDTSSKKHFHEIPHV